MSIDPVAFSRIPTIPAVAVRLLQHFSNPDVSLSAVAEILRPDPALTARLLQAASSAEFGVGRPLTDSRRAVQMLGIRRVTSLALSFILSGHSVRHPEMSVIYRKLWLRSIVQAVAMEQLVAKRVRGAESEHFTIGLLLEIGGLSLLLARPEEMLAIAEAIKSGGLTQEQAEQSVMGCTISDISVSLFRHWRLPPQFAEAVRNRKSGVHDLAHIGTGSQALIIEGAIFADAVADCLTLPPDQQACQRLHGMAGRLRLEQHQLDDLLKLIHARVQASSTLFNIDSRSLIDPGQLRARPHDETASSASSDEQAASLAEAVAEQVSEMVTA